MPYDPIKGQGRSLRSESCRNGRLHSLISFASMQVIKSLTVNYDTPRQYLNFNWTGF